jgi:catechol 2,3-dioxygenase-like lactoylglutathione lyase family enzyme
LIVPTPFFQASWVVPDLEAAMHRWLDVAGTGPFFVNAHVQVSNPRYRGQPTSFDYSLALAQAGPLQIELIEQHDDEPSVYRDSVPRGQEGFHHMAYFADDIVAEFARYRDLGVTLVFEGQFGDMRLGYFDTRPQLGFMVEVLEHRPDIDRLFAHIADAAEDWDGSDPIRSFPIF